MEYESSMSYSSEVISKVKVFSTDRQTNGQTGQKLDAPKTLFPGGIKIKSGSVWFMCILYFLKISPVCYAVSGQEIFCFPGAPTILFRYIYETSLRTDLCHWKWTNLRDFWLDRFMRLHYRQTSVTAEGQSGKI